jgi:CheY-like chemotaxis protein
VVGIAASGGEAVRLAQERRPDVVFMDIQLQGEKDGIETAGELQRKTGLPIIFITAFAEVFLRNPQFMRPPGICLSKPFSISQLQAAIEALGDQAGTE